MSPAVASTNIFLRVTIEGQREGAVVLLGPWVRMGLPHPVRLAGFKCFQMELKVNIRPYEFNTCEANRALIASSVQVDKKKVS